MDSADVEKQYHESPTFVEVLSRLAHEIRESRKASVELLHWLQRQSTIEEKLNKIMGTQTEAAATLRAVAESQKKTIAEIGVLQVTVTNLNQKIIVLEQVVANGEANPELEQAVADVKNLAQLADDQIPDVVTPVPA